MFPYYVYGQNKSVVLAALNGFRHPAGWIPTAALNGEEARNWLKESSSSKSLGEESPEEVVEGADVKDTGGPV